MARRPAARPCLAAAASRDAPLSALLALHWDDYAAFSEAAHRCTRREAEQVMRIAWGHTGFSTAQRLATLSVIARVVWRGMLVWTHTRRARAALWHGATIRPHLTGTIS